MMRRGKKGFTLVEIMIVVAIIGLLAAIAIPNFVRARQKAQTEACIANLRQIEGAIQVWAVDIGANDAAVPIWNDLVPNYVRTIPKCPAAPAGTDAYGTPALPAVSGRPVCSVGGNSTPAHKLP